MDRRMVAHICLNVIFPYPVNNNNRHIAGSTGSCIGPSRRMTRKGKESEPVFRLQHGSAECATVDHSHLRDRSIKLSNPIANDGIQMSRPSERSNSPSSYRILITNISLWLTCAPIVQTFPNLTKIRLSFLLTPFHCLTCFIRRSLLTLNSRSSISGVSFSYQRVILNNLHRLSVNNERRYVQAAFDVEADNIAVGDGDHIYGGHSTYGMD
ncbi:hypothetical protein QCA50_016392 [Cerrena zonata]|uniref:Uncharacterized protein n=1 Tax=Cerrena zonata TaxID=2478898 RepID=A0AAW0FGA9_9APHY